MGSRWDPERYSPMAEYLYPASEAAVGALSLAPGSTIVDVGTGTGNAAIAALERGLRVTGVDSSPAQIDAARARCRGPAARFVVADAEDLPLPDGGADAAVSVFGIVFAADPTRALRELVRCVRPGGVVAFTAFVADGWPGKVRAELADELGTVPPPFPEVWSAADDIACAAAAGGLADVLVETRELRLPLRTASPAVEVTALLPVAAAMRDRLDVAGRWPAARDRLDALLAGIARPGPALVDHYLLAVGRRR